MSAPIIEFVICDLLLVRVDAIVVRGRNENLETLTR
jgi:hypothetical protein